MGRDRWSSGWNNWPLDYEFDRPLNSMTLCSMTSSIISTVVFSAWFKLDNTEVFNELWVKSARNSGYTFKTIDKPVVSSSDVDSIWDLLCE